MAVVKTALRRYVGETGADWQPYVGEVLLVLRCLQTRSHGMTLYFVVFGQEPDLPSFLAQ